MAGTVVTGGLTAIAHAGFVSCYVLQAMKRMTSQVKDVFQGLLKFAFSGGR